MMSDHPVTPLPLHNGLLGLCACPGSSGALFGRANPDAGIDALARWPAHAVVTLMESRELEILGLSTLSGRLRERFPLWLHLPIRDCDVPGERWLRHWSLARLVIAALLAEGRNVAVHCLAGVGRTGTVASMCLVDAGFGDGRRALDHVRRMHTIHAAETPEQEAFVEQYRPPSTLDANSVHDTLADFIAQAGLDPILDKDGRIDPQRTTRVLQAGMTPPEAKLS